MGSFQDVNYSIIGAWISVYNNRMGLVKTYNREERLFCPYVVEDIFGIIVHWIIWNICKNLKVFTPVLRAYEETLNGKNVRWQMDDGKGGRGQFGLLWNDR